MSITSMLMKPRLTWGLSTVLAVAVLCAGIFTMPTPRATADDSIKLDLHDLPEAGLTLVTAADPSFERMLNDVPLLPGSEPLRERLKPFSVFVRNGGTQIVVDYRIVWKVANAAGWERTSTYDTGDGPSLMEGWNQPFGPYGDVRGSVIRPGSSQLSSLLPVPRGAPNGGPMSFGWGGSFPGAPPMAEAGSHGQSQSGSPDDRIVASAARYAELETQQLSVSSKISVSIDGAVFEDGSFVGPDETGFFSRLQSEIKAKHDLFQEFQDMLNAGQPDADVEARLAELTGSKP